MPIIYLSRIAKDRLKISPKVPTECEIYFPWQTETILLQPDHQLGECADVLNPGGCVYPDSHCITQINPDEIVSAYDKMLDYISNVKKIKCPPIIRNANQIFALYSET